MFASLGQIQYVPAEFDTLEDAYYYAKYGTTSLTITVNEAQIAQNPNNGKYVIISGKSQEMRMFYLWEGAWYEEWKHLNNWQFSDTTGWPVYYKIWSCASFYSTGNPYGWNITKI